MGVFRIAIKSLFVILMLIFGFVIIFFSMCLRAIKLINMLQLLFVVRKWYQLLLFFLDIKVHVQSNKQKPDQLKASVVVANHISWLDIVVLGSVIPTHFLSKSEVRNWPLIGWMANQIGTLFIKRGGGGDVDGLKVQMLEYVNDGKNILFFPEGTTGKGDGLMVFRPRLFSTAIDAKANILPLAIKYGLQQGAHPVIPYGSEQTIFVNLLSVMAYGHVDVYVQFGQTISSKETNRDALANTAQKQIGNMLNLSQSQIKQRYQRTNESVAD